MNLVEKRHTDSLGKNKFPCEILIFLGESIQHPFKLHITLLTKLIVDVVSREP